MTFEITLKLQGSKLVWDLTYIMTYISGPEVDIKKILTLFFIAGDANDCAVKVLTSSAIFCQIGYELLYVKFSKFIFSKKLCWNWMALVGGGRRVPLEALKIKK